MTTLDEAPDLYEVPEDDDARRGFVIDGPGKAAWAMRRLAAIERLDRLNAEIAQAEIDRVQRWLDGEKTRNDRNRDFFHDLLARYALARRAENPREKTLTTPYGKVTTREAKDPTWVVDADQLLPWLKEHRPDLVTTEVKETVNKTKVKGKLTVTEAGAVDPDSGEVVPGIELIAPRATATVVPDLTVPEVSR